MQYFLFPNDMLTTILKSNHYSNKTGIPITKGIIKRNKFIKFAGCKKEISKRINVKLENTQLLYSTQVIKASLKEKSTNCWTNKVYIVVTKKVSIVEENKVDVVGILKHTLSEQQSCLNNNRIKLYKQNGFTSQQLQNI